MRLRIRPSLDGTPWACWPLLDFFFSKAGIWSTIAMLVRACSVCLFLRHSPSLPWGILFSILYTFLKSQVTSEISKKWIMLSLRNIEQYFLVSILPWFWVSVIEYSWSSKVNWFCPPEVRAVTQVMPCTPTPALTISRHETQSICSPHVCCTMNTCLRLLL